MNPSTNYYHFSNILRHIWGQYSNEHVTLDIIPHGTDRSIRNYVADLRQVQRLKIAILYKMRNSIVHEAMTYSAEMEFMTKSLEDLLIDTLSQFLSYGKSRKLEMIIAEHNRPFQVRR